MDKDLIRLEKLRAFVERRMIAMRIVIKKHPEGITKNNLQQIKDGMKKEETKED